MSDKCERAPHFTISRVKSRYYHILPQPPVELLMCIGYDSEYVTEWDTSQFVWTDEPDELIDQLNDRMGNEYCTTCFGLKDGSTESLCSECKWEQSYFWRIDSVDESGDLCSCETFPTEKEAREWFDEHPTHFSENLEVTLSHCQGSIENTHILDKTIISLKV